MNKSLLFSSLFIIISVTFSCTKENQDTKVGIDAIDLDTINLPSMMKGWELYSWQNSDSWNYALLGGTNRLKSYNEVISSPYRVCSINSLQKLISKIPSEEHVTWIGEGWLSQCWDEPYYNLQLPPDITINNIKKKCKELDIQLTVAN
jgi:hypothetical protein